MLPSLTISAITVDDISHFFHADVTVHALRLDKISDVVSGNKWFKLRYYLDEAKAMHKKGILTFGGAWSNHIVATAAATHEAGLQSVGIIRGEKPLSFSPTLKQAEAYGMQLIFVSRLDYQLKQVPESFDTSDYLVVNEGGYGTTGAKGASTILDYCEDFYTHYACAVGTGTMLAGLINRLSPAQRAIGISILKNNISLTAAVQHLLEGDLRTNWHILHDYSFGGYARQQPFLIDFMNDFYRATGVPTDFVYTAKLFFGINDLLQQNYFARESKILVIHSGGLQGNRSLPQGTLMF